MRNNKDVDSLSHTTWRCQYRVVFAPKYRRLINIWTDQKRYRADTEAVVRTERDRDNRSGSMPGPHTYADKFSAKVQYRICDGILEREKQSDDF